MPLYEYVCKECRKPYSVRKPFAESSTATVCPTCGSANTQRLISAVAMFSSSGSGGEVRQIARSSPCGGCSLAGACSGGCGCRR